MTSWCIGLCLTTEPHLQRLYNFFFKSYHLFSPLLVWGNLIFLKGAKASRTQNRYELSNYCEKLKSSIGRESNLQSLTLPLSYRLSWAHIVLVFCPYVTDCQLYLEFLKNYVLCDRYFKLLNRELILRWVFVSLHAAAECLRHLQLNSRRDFKKQASLNAPVSASHQPSFLLPSPWYTYRHACVCVCVCV